MASVNKVIIVGNLGRDPETRYSPDGAAITTASVATTDKWKDKNSGEQKEATEWHRLKFFGRLAEIAGEYLKKGSQVYVEGKLRTTKYTDKEGVERYTTDIVVDVMQMLGGRAGMGGGDSDGGYGNERSNERAPAPARPSAGAPNRPAAKPTKPTNFDEMDDDIPF